MNEILESFGVRLKPLHPLSSLFLIKRKVELSDALLDAPLSPTTCAGMCTARVTFDRVPTLLARAFPAFSGNRFSNSASERVLSSRLISEICGARSSGAAH